jgi:hypothetical protein
MEGVAGVAIATSPAMMAYVTTETGVVTMIIMVLLAGYLLTRQAADFVKAEPSHRSRSPDRAPLHRYIDMSTTGDTRIEAVAESSANRGREVQL